MTTNELVPHPSDKSPLAEKAAVKVAKHAAESGHWYRKSGEQIEQVLNVKGDKLIRCTLREARKLNLAPGVTTIIRQAAAPGLELWKRRQSILAAAANPQKPEESEKVWMDRVEEIAAELAAKAAEEGTRIHAALQQAAHGLAVQAEYQAHVDGVFDKLNYLDEAIVWRSEVGVAHPLGYGTKIDLVSSRYLLDFKGKDGDQATLDTLETYDEHDMQLAAGMMAAIEGFDPAVGRVQVDTDRLRCGIVFVSRTHPGACSLRWIPHDKILRGWAMFQALLNYWQLKTGHRPWKEAS